MMHIRHVITAVLLCVCLTAAAGCKKGSQPEAKPEAVKQTIAMEQPAAAPEPTPPAAEAGKTAPEAAQPAPAATEQPPAMTAGEKDKAADQPAEAEKPAAPPEQPGAPASETAAEPATPAPEADEEAEEAIGQEETQAEGEDLAGAETPAEPEVVLDLMDIEADASDAGDEVAKKEEESLFSPFTPLFRKDEKNEMVVDTDSPQQRAFLTPLERISLGQLQLSGIIRANSGNRAIVTDATGKGYVIKKGTYIGLNSGRVENIVEDRVVVVEMIGGRKSVTELKLQKPAGE